MAKNTKPKVVKTEKTKVKFERRIITAIRDSSPISPDFYVEPKVAKTDRPLKAGGKMETVFNVLNGKGKVNIEDAIDQFLQIQTVNAKDSRKRVRTIFLQANQYKVPVKIEKVDKNIYIQLA